MIQLFERSVCLHTLHTSYIFRVLETGQLEHLHYGKRVRVETEEDLKAYAEKHVFAPGNTNVYDGEHKQASLEDMCLEYSSYGKGDVREPMLIIRDADGACTSDFTFVSMGQQIGRCELQTMPTAYTDDNDEERLEVVLEDKERGLKLYLDYCIYEEADVITRTVRLENCSTRAVQVERLLTLQVDYPTADYVWSTFNGAWAREMHRTDQVTLAGLHVNAAFAGTSSSHANPFVMLAEPKAGEDAGEVYGFNLLYSGNHYEAVEVSSFRKLRFVAGINPRGFSYLLEAGECFEAPEGVMTFSHEGYNGMSRNMHTFVRKHVVRGKWRDKARPILLNSWEAAYFDINESKLLRLAKEAKNVGIELLVMDDGWFGNREDDTKSLGDWTPNKKKLPGGVAGICEKVNKLGLSFGIWVEPEMVNVDSDLYRTHPEWVMQIPDCAHSEGRNQRILDLANPAVQDYIIETMGDLFQSANIEYVKWDMNRTFSDVYSPYLPAEKQGETAHRYVMGLYRCMKELTEAFPEILFEGCASGGNRFDLGILSYFPQIWASDDTDAMCRAEIQYGYSYGYPLSVVSAHVSGTPNHQTLRITPMESRFAVAAYGVLGYECNLCDMSKEQLGIIRAQVELYKQWREVFFFGTFYRGRDFEGRGSIEPRGSVLTPAASNVMEWTVVSGDGDRAVGMLLQKQAIPNVQFQYYRPKGLREEVRYRLTNQVLKHNIKVFGDLVNTIAPVHVKQDSLLHDILAKFVKMDGETEDYSAYGDLLMHGGVKLAQAFAGTGYDTQVRLFPDYAARLYFLEKI